jgi:hypothetical protein
MLTSTVIQALFGPCSGVSANLQISTPILQSVSVSPSSLQLLAAGTGTVQVSGPAPAGGLIVSLGSTAVLSNVLLQIPATVTIPQGATTGTFSVKPILSLGILSAATQATITAVLNSVNVSTILSVLPVL